MEKNIDKLLFDKDFYKSLSFATKSDGDYFVESVDTLKIAKFMIVDKYKRDIGDTRVHMADLIVDERANTRDFKEKLEMKKLMDKKMKIEEDLKKLEIVFKEKEDANKEEERRKKVANTLGLGKTSVTRDRSESNGSNNSNKSSASVKETNRSTIILEGELNSPTRHIDGVNFYNELAAMYSKGEFCVKDGMKIKNILDKYKDLIR
jgi:hypothetical protein